MQGSEFRNENWYSGLSVLTCVDGIGPPTGDRQRRWTSAGWLLAKSCKSATARLALDKCGRHGCWSRVKQGQSVAHTSSPHALRPALCCSMIAPSPPNWCYAHLRLAAHGARRCEQQAVCVSAPSSGTLVHPNSYMNL